LTPVGGESGVSFTEQDMSKANIYVRDIEKREIVHTIEVTNPSPRKVARVVAGLLRNMNTKEFYVDDSEVDFQ
jgi:hypothetical protein